MPVESSPVEIRITVVDSNSGEVIAQLERNLTQVGAAGASSGQKVAQGMDNIGRHSLTALDNVRLLRDDIGIRIPRSMEKAIASSQAMMTAINAVGSGLLAIGTIDIGIRIVEGLKHVYDNYLSLTSAAKKYNEEVEKSKLEDFGNTRSIEDTRLRIDEAKKSMNAFNAAAKEFAGGESFWERSWSFMRTMATNPTAAIANQFIAGNFAGTAIQSQEQLGKLTPREVEQQHQQNLLQIEKNHALDAELRGRLKITAELEKQKQLNAENRRYDIQMSKTLGNPVAADSGASDERLKNQIAEGKAQAETYNLQREQAHDLMRLRAEATQASLHGSALYKAQEEAAIEELKFKDEDSVAFRNAVHQKFHTEEMKRLEEQRRETERIGREAATAGLTGIAKMQAEGANRVADLNADLNLDPAERAKRIEYAHQATNQEVLSAQEDFRRKIDSLADESAQHQISGFARIHAEEKRQLDALYEDFKRTYGQLNPDSAEYKQGQMQLFRGQQAIHGGAYQQEVDLARRNEQETEQIEMQARIRSLSAEKQKTAAIEAEYEERLRKYQEQLQQQEISEQDFNRRVVAAQRERDAEMVEEARQAREKLAGQLSGFFRNPMEALKNIGDKMAGEAAAAVIQRIHGRLPGAGRGPQSTGLGGIFDRIAGAHLPGMPEYPHGSVGTASGSMMTIATAQIHIGSASIIGAGAASYGGAAIAGGSTFGTLGALGEAGTASASTVTGGLTLGAGGAIVPQAAGIGAGGTGGIGSILGDVQQGAKVAKSTGDLIGSLKNKGGFGQSMLGGGGLRNNALGALGGAMGLFSAFEGNGGFGGAASGALSGMQFGMSVAGPIGAAVGAVGGAIMGAFGFGGREKARVYWLKQGQPRLFNDMDSFQQGAMDYLTAYMDMEQLLTEAKHTTNKMGPAAEGYYQDTIKPAIAREEQKLTREQKAGRSEFGFSAAMFDIGTDYVPRTGYAIIHEGERIVPSDQNERITRAIEGGSGVMPVDTGANGDTHLHVHAIDAKSAVQFLMNNKQAVRAALNASFAEYGGMANV
jgi:hypothetical protein